MKYQIKILLISICIIGIVLSQSKEKDIVSQNKIVQTDPDTKKWDNADKNIQDPELQKLLEELKMEFKTERDALKKDFKKRVDALKEEYSNKRENLKKKYKKRNKKKRPDKKPETLDPNRKKEKPKETKKFNKEEIKKGKTETQENIPIINKK